MIQVKPRYVNVTRKDKRIDILFFGESPGADEADQGKAFVGVTGKTILQPILDVEFKGKKICLDNSCPEWLGKGNKPDGKKLKEWKEYREESIRKHNPRVIVLLGAVALRAFGCTRKPTNAAGDIVQTDGRTFVYSTHPASVLYRSESVKYLKKAFKSVKRCLQRKGSLAYQVVDSVEEARPLLQKLAKSPCAFDLETSSLDWQTGEILCAAITQDKDTYAFPLYHPEQIPECADDWRRKEYFSDLMKLLCSWWSRGPRICQNAKYELHWMRKYIRLFWNKMEPKDPDILYCTMLQEWLLNEEARKDLNFMVINRLKRRPYWLEIDPYRKDMSAAPLDSLMEYCCWDTRCTWDMHILQRSEMSSEIIRLADEMIHPMVKVLCHIEERGIKIDHTKMKSLIKANRSKVTRLENQIKKIWPDLNVRSGKQLIELLFTKPKSKGGLRLKPVATTDKDTPKTDNDSMIKLAKQDKRVKPLTDLKQVKSLLSRALEPFLEKSQFDGCLHTQFGLGMTVTGRLTSSNPNLQNVDKKGVQRTAMVSRFPGGKIIQGDYSQHEYRIMAAFCGIEKLLDALKKGQDSHQLTADLITKSGTDCDRDTGKNVNFATIFDITAYGLRQKYDIPLKEGGKLLRAWHKEYPELKLFWFGLIQQMENLGYVSNLFGFRRHVTDTSNGHQKRQGYNSPIQGTAVMICYLAMIDLEKRLRTKQACMVGQIHDSIVVDSPPEEVDDSCDQMRKSMLGVDIKSWDTQKMLKAPIPLAVEIKVNDHF